MPAPGDAEQPEAAPAAPHGARFGRPDGEAGGAGAGAGGGQAAESTGMVPVAWSGSPEPRSPERTTGLSPSSPSRLQRKESRVEMVSTWFATPQTQVKKGDSWLTRLKGSAPIDKLLWLFKCALWVISIWVSVYFAMQWKKLTHVTTTSIKEEHASKLNFPWTAIIPPAGCFLKLDACDFGMATAVRKLEDEELSGGQLPAVARCTPEFRTSIGDIHKICDCRDAVLTEGTVAGNFTPLARFDGRNRGPNFTHAFDELKMRFKVHCPNRTSFQYEACDVYSFDNNTEFDSLHSIQNADALENFGTYDAANIGEATLLAFSFTRDEYLNGTTKLHTKFIPSARNLRVGNDTVEVFARVETFMQLVLQEIEMQPKWYVLFGNIFGWVGILIGVSIASFFEEVKGIVEKTRAVAMEAMDAVQQQEVSCPPPGPQQHQAVPIT